LHKKCLSIELTANRMFTRGTNYNIIHALNIANQMQLHDLLHEDATQNLIHIFIGCITIKHSWCHDLNGVNIIFRNNKICSNEWIIIVS